MTRYDSKRKDKARTLTRKRERRQKYAGDSVMQLAQTRSVR